MSSFYSLEVFVNFIIFAILSYPPRDKCTPDYINNVKEMGPYSVLYRDKYHSYGCAPRLLCAEIGDCTRAWRLNRVKVTQQHFVCIVFEVVGVGQ